MIFNNANMSQHKVLVYDIKFYQAIVIRFDSRFSSSVYKLSKSNYLLVRLHYDDCVQS